MWQLEMKVLVLFFLLSFMSILPNIQGLCVWWGWGVMVGVDGVSSLAVCEWTTAFPFVFSPLLSVNHFIWPRPILVHFSTVKLHSLFPWSVFSSMLSNFYLSLSISSRLGPLLYPLSPAFLSKVCRSVFLLSPAVLHSCFSCEGGGQGRGREEEEGGTWALQREGEGEGKGEGGPLSLWECLLPGVLRGEPQHD